MGPTKPPFFKTEKRQSPKREGRGCFLGGRKCSNPRLKYELLPLRERHETPPARTKTPLSKKKKVKAGKKMKKTGPPWPKGKPWREGKKDKGYLVRQAGQL